MAETEEPMISRYLSGQLSPGEMKEFEARLASDPQLWPEIRANKLFHHCAGQTLASLLPSQAAALEELARKPPEIESGGLDTTQKALPVFWTVPTIESSPVRRRTLLPFSGSGDDTTSSRSFGASIALHALALYGLTFFTTWVTAHTPPVVGWRDRNAFRIGFIPPQANPPTRLALQPQKQPTDTPLQPTFEPLPRNVSLNIPPKVHQDPPRIIHHPEHPTPPDVTPPDVTPPDNPVHDQPTAEQPDVQEHNPERTTATQSDSSSAEIPSSVEKAHPHQKKNPSTTKSSETGASSRQASPAPSLSMKMASSRMALEAPGTEANPARSHSSAASLAAESALEPAFSAPHSPTPHSHRAAPAPSNSARSSKASHSKTSRSRPSPEDMAAASSQPDAAVFSGETPASGAPAKPSPRKSKPFPNSTPGGDPGILGEEVGGGRSTAAGSSTGASIPHTAVGQPDGRGLPGHGSGSGPRAAEIALGAGSARALKGESNWDAGQPSAFAAPGARSHSAMTEAGEEDGQAGAILFPDQPGRSTALPTEGSSSGATVITGLDQTAPHTHSRRQRGGSASRIAAAPVAGAGQAGGLDSTFAGVPDGGPSGFASGPGRGSVPYNAFNITGGSDEAGGPGGPASHGYFGGPAQRHATGSNSELPAGTGPPHRNYGHPHGRSDSSAIASADIAGSSGGDSSIFGGGIPGADSNPQRPGRAARGSIENGGEGDTVSLHPGGQHRAGSGGGDTAFPGPSDGSQGTTGRSGRHGHGPPTDLAAVGGEDSGDGAAFGAPDFSSGSDHPHPGHHHSPLNGAGDDEDPFWPIGPPVRDSAAGSPVGEGTIHPENGIGKKSGGHKGSHPGPLDQQIAGIGGGDSPFAWGGDGAGSEPGPSHKPGRKTKGHSTYGGDDPEGVDIAMAGPHKGAAGSGGDLPLFGPGGETPGTSKGHAARSYHGAGSTDSADLAPGAFDGGDPFASDTQSSGGRKNGPGKHRGFQADVAGVGGGDESAFDPGTGRRNSALPADPFSDLGGDYEMPGAIAAKDYDWHIQDLAKLLASVSQATDIKVSLLEHYVEIESLPLLPKAPLVVFTGHHPFSLKPEQREALRSYVQRGGMIWGDYSHTEGFDQSFREEMVLTFKQQPHPLPLDHGIYSSRYSFASVPDGDLGQNELFQGINAPGSNRLAVVITPNRYFGALDGPPHVSQAVYEEALKVGVNIYLYAVHHYKEISGE